MYNACTFWTGRSFWASAATDALRTESLCLSSLHPPRYVYVPTVAAATISTKSSTFVRLVPARARRRVALSSFALAPALSTSSSPLRERMLASRSAYAGSHQQTHCNNSHCDCNAIVSDTRTRCARCVSPATASSAAPSVSTSTLPRHCATARFEASLGPRDSCLVSTMRFRISACDTGTLETTEETTSHHRKRAG